MRRSCGLEIWGDTCGGAAGWRYGEIHEAELRVCALALADAQQDLHRAQLVQGGAHRGGEHDEAHHAPHRHRLYHAPLERARALARGQPHLHGLGAGVKLGLGV